MTNISSKVRVPRSSLLGTEKIPIQDSVGSFNYTTPDDLGGGMALLASYSPSGVAQLDIPVEDWSDDFVGLQIHILNLLAATDNTTLNLRVSADGGSSFDSSGYMYASKRAFTDAGGDGFNQSTSAGEIVLNQGNGVGNGSNEGLSCCIHMAPLGITTKQRFRFDTDTHTDNDLGARVMGMGMRTTAQITTHLRLFYSSGNIASGEVRVFGIP